MKKLITRVLSIVIGVGLLAVGFYYQPKAASQGVILLKYETTNYTRNLYDIEAEQIRNGIYADALTWVKDECNHATYLSNGAVTIDSQAVVEECRKQIVAGNLNVTINLENYVKGAASQPAVQPIVTQPIAAQPVAAAAPVFNAVPNVSNVGMTPQIAANLNKIGIDCLISSCSTKYREGQDRTVNIKTAAGRLNGLIIQPGQVFSYDTAILPRTAENGYGMGDIISGDKHVKAIGGGICQVSSTLNNCVLKAGIVPLERHNHSQRVMYLPSGLDATVTAGRMDYRFVNTLAYPIYVATSTVNGVLTVEFYSNRNALNGMTFNTVVDGSNAKNSTYIVGYLNGIEVSRVKAYSSSYK